ncbi:MAG: tetratricopeptide (TPR) repeat protein [Cognaticolwellia sp.]|jgi:tetratricopeptide (TPR) repeat protein
MKYIYLLFAIAIISLNSCKSDITTASDENLSIEALEDSIFTKEGGIKPAQDTNGKKLIAAYEALAASDVPDSVAVEMLFKAAAIAKNVNRDFTKSVEVLNKLYKDFPKSPRAGDAQFMEAYTYANDMQDYDKAKKLYDTFLAQYPDHAMFKTGVLEVRNLGKTPEMMIEEFKKRNAK